MSVHVAYRASAPVEEPGTPPAVSLGAAVFLAALVLLGLVGTVFAPKAGAETHTEQRPSHDGLPVACNTHNHVTNQLSAHFGEQPVLRGLASNGQMMEVYASESGQWTIAFTQPNGETCVSASGRALDVLDRDNGAQDAVHTLTTPSETL